MSQDTSKRSFDELARVLASGSVTRGKALRLMGAALLGGTLASLGIRQAAADNLCKPGRKKCNKDKQCCSGACVGGTCRPAGTLFTCTCAFTQTHHTCSSAPCDGDGLKEVCTSVCANHGLWTSGSCDNVPCAIGSCPPGETVCGGECCTAGESCYRFGAPTNTEPICCKKPDCVGVASAAGPPVCITTPASVDICNRPTCNTDAECSGEVCVQTPGCPGGGNRCAPAC